MKLDGLSRAVHRGLRRSKLHPNELHRSVWGNLLGDRTACSHGRELEMEEQDSQALALALPWQPSLPALHLSSSQA